MMKSVRDYDVQGKRVLVRCDLNVPQNAQGNSADDFRIAQSLPTIQYLMGRRAKVILLTHWGDPKGSPQESLRVDVLAARLGALLGTRVAKLADCIGKDVEREIAMMSPGDVVLLENLRFHAEEEANDEEFAKSLAVLGDFFVSDGFGVLHRKHASVVRLPLLLPASTGFLVEKELEALSRLLKNPVRPMVALVGGIKVESKLAVIDALTEVADWVLLGNVLATETQEKNVQFRRAQKIVLPVDGIPGNGQDFDIGFATQKLFAEKIKEAKTVFWTGPLGRYEDPAYGAGSLAMVLSIHESGAFSVAGGGNLADFLGEHGLRENFSHVSTGGGAMLAFVAGERLPGLAALDYYGN